MSFTFLPVDTNHGHCNIDSHHLSFDPYPYAYCGGLYSYCNIHVLCLFLNLNNYPNHNNDHGNVSFSSCPISFNLYLNLNGGLCPFVYHNDHNHGNNYPLCTCFSSLHTHHNQSPCLYMYMYHEYTTGGHLWFSF